MSGRKFVLAIIIILIPHLLKAQENDFNFWTILDLGKNINKWEFNIELEARQSGFFDKALRYSLQPEVNYKIIKPLKVGASYSLMSVYDLKYDDYQSRNRYSLFLEGKFKIERFSFRLREKWELTTKDEADRVKLNGEIDTYKINPEQIWRNKIKVVYDVPDLALEPAIAVETFYQINNPDGNELEKVRYTISLSYNFDKKNTLEAFSHINDEKIDDFRKLILGIGFSHTF